MSGLYTKLIAHILFPLHERLKSHDTVKVRRELERTQWLSRKELNKLQSMRLRELVKSAAQHVPYYARLFQDAGINENNITSVNDLSRLPFLTKTKIRENIENLKADNANGLAKFNTGGSSGEPLIFFIGRERVSHDVAAKWRATRWWDVDIGDPEIVVWGSPIELGAQDYLRTLRDKLLRTQLLPAFEMSDSKLRQFLTTIRNARPKMLFGYPSAISHIARYAAKIDLCMNDLGIKVVFVTSERLYDDQRRDIERVFACNVANGYGGRDAGFIAHECPEGGMHITAEDIIVEIVDQAGKVLPHGEMGEIVVTHLATREFPFIRYRTGDIGILDDNICPCGRGLPLLKEIQGRTTDFVVAHDGTVMHGLALIYILRELPEILSFKIIQEGIDKTRILIVSNKNITKQASDQIINGFQQRLGKQTEIVIEQVNQIKPERSGKFRYVISNVDIENL